MPKVYMYPNPRLGMPTRSGAPETSVFLADPLVAHLPEVQAHLGAVASTMAARAAGRLATVKALSTRSAGPLGSFIQLEHGYLDYYVILNDTRSDWAAAAIESDHGILESAIPLGQGRLAVPSELLEAQVEKDPVKGGYPDGSS